MDENENVQQPEQPAAPAPQPEPAPAPAPEPAPAPAPEQPAPQPAPQVDPNPQPAAAPYQQPAPQAPYEQPAQPYQQAPYQQPVQPQYQQPYQQAPYQQPYQQPVYQQPVAPAPAPVQVLPATPAEKEALFKSAGSFWMLIVAIVATISLIPTLIGNIIPLPNIFGLLTYVLDILIVVGFWVTWAKCRKKSLSTSGIKLMKVPYIIQFVFSVISFVFHLVLWFLTLNVISLLIGIVTFVFEVICFASILKTLKMAQSITQDQTTVGKKAGIFAAVVMIISATLTLASEIVSYVFIAELLDAANIPFLSMLLGGGSVIGLVAAIISFLASISVALVLLQFAKNIKKAHNGEPV